MKDTTALALLLIAGHLVADFVVQTAKVAEHKRRFWILLRHGAESYLVMTAVLWPFWSAKLMAGLAALVVLHLAVDAARVRLKPSVGVFLADQAAHLAVLAVFWRFLSPGGNPESSARLVPGPLVPLVCLGRVLRGAAGIQPPRGQLPGAAGLGVQSPGAGAAAGPAGPGGGHRLS